MLSFTGQSELFQELASDADASNLSLGKKLINIGLHKFERKLGTYVGQKRDTFTTVTDALDAANQQYQLPRGFLSLTDLFVTIGTTEHFIEELIQDLTWWRRLNSTTTQSTSNFLSHAYIEGRKVFLWPIPSSANTATILYQGTSKDLSQADHVDGTITTLTNGGVTVTGDSTAWTGQMVGRIFKINADGEWHRIKAFSTATSITLETAYQGAAISAGTDNYTIGEAADLPEDTFEVPVLYALWQYFARFKRDKFMAQNYKTDWKEAVQEAIADYGNAGTSAITTMSPIVGRGGAINPNFFPTSLS